MQIIKCIHTDSKCYKWKEKASMKGIVVHSTACNNKYLKRYIKPSTTDPDYSYLMSILGVNKYGNHWNKSGANKAVHYMIGCLDNGTLTTMQTLPEDICCFGCGKGSKGSYNYNPTAHIQFEILEDNLKDKVYFTNAYKMAVELCADICKRHGWRANVIVSHKEAHAKGYGSNHGDIDHWLKKHNLTMDDFRKDVNNLLDGGNIGTAEYDVYIVAKNDTLWGIAKKLLGSGFKYTEIKKLNGLKSDAIYQGMKLMIPNTKKSEYMIYTVVKGDNLWNIAKKFLGAGAKYTKIKELNGLKSDLITPGQKLKIPNK